MKTFKDAKGREWAIDINVTSAKRVKTLTELDLLAVNKGQIDCVARMEADTALLCDVLHALCKPEADAKGVDAEDFGTGLRGVAIANATKALLEDLVDFCLDPRMGTALQRVLQAGQTATSRHMDLVETRLDSLLPELVEQAASGQPSGGAPGFSA